MQPKNLLNYLLEKSNEPLSFYVDNNTRYTFAMTKDGLFSFKTSVDWYSVYESRFLSLYELQKDLKNEGIRIDAFTPFCLTQNLDFIALHDHYVQARKINADITQIDAKVLEHTSTVTGTTHFSTAITVWDSLGNNHNLVTPLQMGNVNDVIFRRVKAVTYITDKRNLTQFCREQGIKLNIKTTNVSRINQLFKY